MAGPFAFVREVGDSFVRCVTSHPVSPPLDPAAARRQHDAYRAALESGGFAVIAIPADERHPDGCFVEDAAIVMGGRALATRPGHPSRRGEVGPVAAALGERMPVSRMEAPAVLDGGDVLVAGDSVFVGRSGRTNAAGVAALSEFVGGDCRVVPVPVEGPLHLKSVVTVLDHQTLLIEPGRLDPDPFSAFRMVPIPAGDPDGANVVRLPDGRILASDRHRRSAETIAAAGFEVATVDVSEFGRADGGLTCLSIRIRGR